MPFLLLLVLLKNGNEMGLRALPLQHLCSACSRNLLEKLSLSLPPLQSFLGMGAEEVLDGLGGAWCLCWAVMDRVGLRMGKDLSSKHLNSDILGFAGGVPQRF